MQRGKEILIFLLFVVFSCFIWLLRAENKQWERQTASSPNQETATAPDTFTDKKMEVTVDVQDVPDGYKIRLFPSRVTVFMRVKVSDYGEISEEDVHVWCSYPSRSMETLTLHADAVNSRIVHVRVQPEKVEYLIEQE